MPQSPQQLQIPCFHSPADVIVWKNCPLFQHCIITMYSRQILKFSPKFWFLKFLLSRLLPTFWGFWFRRNWCWKKSLGFRKFGLEKSIGFGFGKFGLGNEVSVSDSENLVSEKSLGFGKLDPVGSTVRYEMMKLYTGTVLLTCKM